MSFISSTGDTQLFIPCGGDEQLMIICLGYEEWGFGGMDTVPPVLTISYPDGSTINSNNMLVQASLNEAGTCNYSIDGGTNNTLTAIDSMNFNQDITTPVDGNHTITLYCSDLFSNSISGSVSFNVFKSTGGGSGGSGSGQTGLLYKLNITSEKYWIYDKKNEIIITPLDIKNNITEIDTLELILPQNFKYDVEVNKKKGGKYLAKVNISNRDILKVKVTFKARKGDKIIYTFAEYPLLELEDFLEIYPMEKEFDIFKDKITLIHFLGFILFIISIFFLILLYYKDEREKNEFKKAALTILILIMGLLLGFIILFLISPSVTLEESFNNFKDKISLIWALCSGLFILLLYLITILYFHKKIR